MAQGIGIPLQNHLAGFVQREGQASQPADHPPDQAVINDGLIDGGRLRRSLAVLRRGIGKGISDALPVVHDGVSITDFRLVELMAMGILSFPIPEEALGGSDKARGGEPFIGQDEKRGSP